jgi:hypothetical protein
VICTGKDCAVVRAAELVLQEAGTAEGVLKKTADWLRREIRECSKREKQTVPS